MVNTLRVRWRAPRPEPDIQGAQLNLSELRLALPVITEKKCPMSFLVSALRATMACAGVAGGLVSLQAAEVPLAVTPVAETAPTADSGPELTLPEVIARAIANTRSQIAAGRTRAERMRLAVARGVLLPQVEGFAIYDRSRDYAPASGLGSARGPDDEWRAGLRLEQPLFDASARRLYDRAVARVDELDAERLQVEDSQALFAAEAWIELARATALVSAREEDRELAIRFAELAQMQVEAGVAEPLDALRAATTRAEAEGIYLQAVQLQRRAAVQVLRAIDLPQTGVLPRPQGDLPMPPESLADMAELMREAVSSRPEMAATAAALAAVEAQLAAIRQARLPRVLLVGEVGVRGSEFDDAGEAWRIGLDVRVPIINGFSYGPRVDASQLDVLRLRLLRDDTLASIAAAVQTAVHDLGSTVSRAAVSAQGLALGREELRLAEERFRIGVASNLELVTAQRALARARGDDIAARHDRALAAVRLAAALGRLREWR